MKNAACSRWTCPATGRAGRRSPAGFRWTCSLQAVEAVRAEAKADRLVLVGRSRRAVIRQCARLYPQRVALVLVDGVVALGAPPRPASPRSRRRSPTRCEAQAAWREAMIRGMSAVHAEAAPDHVLKMMLAAPEATAYGAMTATFDPAIWKGGGAADAGAGHLCRQVRTGEPRRHQTSAAQLRVSRGPRHRALRDDGEAGESNRLLERFVDALPAAPPPRR